MHDTLQRAKAYRARRAHQQAIEKIQALIDHDLKELEQRPAEQCRFWIFWMYWMRPTLCQ